MHFEELWELCEKKCQDENSLQLLETIQRKLDFYKIILSRQDLPKEDSDKIKSKIIGEVLFDLTGISLIDRIDVFKSLAESYSDR